MHSDIKEKAWLQMKQAGELTEDDRELYLFGFIQGIVLLLNIFTSLCIGFVLDMLFEVVLYMCCFIPLRIFAGGYHARTQLRCYIMSGTTTVLVLHGIRFLETYSSALQWIVLGLSVFVVWIFAPVQDRNKPLSNAECKRYRKRVHKLLVFFLLVLLVSQYCQKQVVLSSIMCSIYFISIVMLTGLWKQQY